MIYEPSEDSYLLAEAVKKYAFGNVLDVGTGSGIQAITASKLKKVKKVLAVDVSDEVITGLKKTKLDKKIKIKKSDLFSKIKERFDTVVFNPPYLPRDKREPEDIILATTGGKHGYELLQKFICDLNDHLTAKGIALIVFSSLTNKDKIDEVLHDCGFDFELLDEQKIAFESLYVYKIKRNWLLTELFRKNVTNVKRLTKGHRGIIFTGIYKSKKVAIKAQRLDLRTRTVDREANMIDRLNKNGIAPKVLFRGSNFFAYNFIEGISIKEFLEMKNKNEIKKVLLEVLRQCRVLDELNITKEEMHNPYKHVLINKKVVLIDFERTHYDINPKNITQFCQYIIRNNDLMMKKGMKLNQNELILLAKEYKNKQNDTNYRKIKLIIEVL